jgi:hypothetical protein
MCPFHMITISTYIIETHFDVIFTLIIIKFIESETRIQDVRPHVGLILSDLNQRTPPCQGAFQMRGY